MVCTSCYMYCHQPRCAHRGLAKPCVGGDHRTGQGSRAQARTDFGKLKLPGREKAPLAELRTPSADERQRWAKSLEVDVSAGGGDQADDGAAGSAAGTAAALAPSTSAAAGPLAPATEAMEGAQALRTPTLQEVLKAHGFEATVMRVVGRPSRRAWRVTAGGRATAAAAEQRRRREANAAVRPRLRPLGRAVVRWMHAELEAARA